MEEGNRGLEEFLGGGGGEEEAAGGGFANRSFTYNELFDGLGWGDARGGGGSSPSANLAASTISAPPTQAMGGVQGMPDSVSRPDGRLDAAAGGVRKNEPLARGGFGRAAAAGADKDDSIAQQLREMLSTYEGGGGSMLNASSFSTEGPADDFAQTFSNALVGGGGAGGGRGNVGIRSGGATGGAVASSVLRQPPQQLQQQPPPPQPPPRSHAGTVPSAAAAAAAAATSFSQQLSGGGAAAPMDLSSTGNGGGMTEDSRNSDAVSTGSARQSTMSKGRSGRGARSSASGGRKPRTPRVSPRAGKRQLGAEEGQQLQKAWSLKQQQETRLQPLSHSVVASHAGSFQPQLQLHQAQSQSLQSLPSGPSSQNQSLSSSQGQPAQPRREQPEPHSLQRQLQQAQLRQRQQRNPRPQPEPRPQATAGGYLVPQLQASSGGGGGGGGTGGGLDQELESLLHSRHQAAAARPSSEPMLPAAMNKAPPAQARQSAAATGYLGDEYSDWLSQVGLSFPPAASKTPPPPKAAVPSHPHQGGSVGNTKSSTNNSTGHEDQSNYFKELLGIDLDLPPPSSTGGGGGVGSATKRSSVKSTNAGSAIGKSGGRGNVASTSSAAAAAAAVSQPQRIHAKEAVSSAAAAAVAAAAQHQLQRDAPPTSVEDFFASVTGSVTGGGGGGSGVGGEQHQKQDQLGLAHPHQQQQLVGQKRQLHIKQQDQQQPRQQQLQQKSQQGHVQQHQQKQRELPHMQEEGAPAPVGRLPGQQTSLHTALGQHQNPAEGLAEQQETPNRLSGHPQQQHHHQQHQVMAELYQRLNERDLRQLLKRTQEQPAHDSGTTNPQSGESKALQQVHKGVKTARLAQTQQQQQQQRPLQSQIHQQRGQQQHPQQPQPQLTSSQYVQQLAQRKQQHLATQQLSMKAQLDPHGRNGHSNVATNVPLSDQAQNQPRQQTLRQQQLDPHQQQQQLQNPRAKMFPQQTEAKLEQDAAVTSALLRSHFAQHLHQSQPDTTQQNLKVLQREGILRELGNDGPVSGQSLMKSEQLLADLDSLSQSSKQPPPQPQPPSSHQQLQQSPTGMEIDTKSLVAEKSGGSFMDTESVSMSVGHGGDPSTMTASEVRSGTSEMNTEMDEIRRKTSELVERVPWMSQRLIVKLSGVSQSVVSNWIRGQSSARSEKAKVVCNTMKRLMPTFYPSALSYDSQQEFELQEKVSIEQLVEASSTNSAAPAATPSESPSPEVAAATVAAASTGRDKMYHTLGSSPSSRSYLSGGGGGVATHHVAKASSGARRNRLAASTGGMNAVEAVAGANANVSATPGFYNSVTSASTAFSNGEGNTTTPAPNSAAIASSGLTFGMEDVLVDTPGGGNDAHDMLKCTSAADDFLELQSFFGEDVGSGSGGNKAATSGMKVSMLDRVIGGLPFSPPGGKGEAAMQ